MMKNLFSKFCGKSEELFKGDVGRDFAYCLIKVPIYIDSEEANRMAHVFSRLFRLIEDTGGDVNGFCCDILLALYGLPLDDKYLFRHLYDLLVGLSKIDEQLTAIVGKDRGLYGAIGYEKRMIVTALGARMLSDFRLVNTLQEGNVYIHRDVAQKIEEIDRLEAVKVI